MEIVIFNKGSSKRRINSTPRDASRKSGRVRRRSVWPVGAVSKMMRVKWAYSGFLVKATTLLMATASSTPGGSVSSSSPVSLVRSVRLVSGGS